MLRDDSGLASPLLRVVSDRTPDDFGSDAVEEHIVPLVPAIVSESSVATQTLYITPPQGLLQLGRRRMVLNYLRHALLVRVRVGTGRCSCPPAFLTMRAYSPADGRKQQPLIGSRCPRWSTAGRRPMHRCVLLSTAYLVRCE